jgi:toxin ParE1/3/4
MNIRWTAKAFLSLEQISHHIADDNPEAAAKTVQSIYERIEELVTFPNRGRIGRREGTRELVLAPLPYIAVYRVKDSSIEILQIRHGAQNPN